MYKNTENCWIKFTHCAYIMITALYEYYLYDQSIEVKNEDSELVFVFIFAYGDNLNRLECFQRPCKEKQKKNFEHT